MDKKILRIKQMLHKPIQCTRCRNLRIAAELDALDENYSVKEDEITF